MSANRVRCVVLAAVAAAAGCGKAPDPPKPPAPPAVDPGPKQEPIRILSPEEMEQLRGAKDRIAPPPRPVKERPAPGFRHAALTKGELSSFVSHIPEPIRKLYGSDSDLFRDLGGLAFAWEFAGGPVRVWIAVEEYEQSTVPKRWPLQEDDWLVKAETGRVVFWMRRGVSDKVNSALERADKPTGDTSAVGLGVVVSGQGASLDASVAHKNPLWYG